MPRSGPAREHLAIYLPSLEAGGAEQVMATLANGFVQRDIRVSLLLARASGRHLSSLDEKVEVIPLGTGGVARSAPNLALWLRLERPATLLSAMTHANLVAAAVAPRGVRLVLSERMSLAARQNFYDTRGEKIAEALMPLLYRRAARIIVPARSMVPALAKHLGATADKFTAIGNPVVDEGFAERAAEPWPFGEALARDGSRIIVAAGRLTAVKDYDTLIGAFARIAGRKKVHLVILGEGQEREHLEQLVGRRRLIGRVHLPGFSENPAAAMRQGGVFVLSSRFEGLPNVVIQALAAGARVVSTNCETGPAEILEDGAWGCLVPVGDVAALGEAMLTALDAPDWPDGRVRAAAFEAKKVIDGYLDVLFPHASKGGK